MPKAGLEDMVAMEVDDAANVVDATPPVQVQAGEGTEQEAANANLEDSPDDPGSELACVATGSAGTNLDREQGQKAGDADKDAGDTAKEELLAVGLGEKPARTPAHKKVAKAFTRVHRRLEDTCVEVLWHRGEADRLDLKAKSDARRLAKLDAEYLNLPNLPPIPETEGTDLGFGEG